MLLYKVTLIGEYIKRLILKRQTGGVSAPNTKSQALFKQVQAREGEKGKAKESIGKYFFSFLL